MDGRELRDTFTVSCLGRQLRAPRVRDTTGAHQTQPRDAVDHAPPEEARLASGRQKGILHAQRRGETVHCAYRLADQRKRLLDRNDIGANTGQPTRQRPHPLVVGAITFPRIDCQHAYHGKNALALGAPLRMFWLQFQGLWRYEAGSTRTAASTRPRHGAAATDWARHAARHRPTRFPPTDPGSHRPPTE